MPSNREFKIQECEVHGANVICVCVRLRACVLCACKRSELLVVHVAEVERGKKIIKEACNSIFMVISYWGRGQGQNKIKIGDEDIHVHDVRSHYIVNIPGCAFSSLLRHLLDGLTMYRGKVTKR